MNCFILKESENTQLHEDGQAISENLAIKSNLNLVPYNFYSDDSFIARIYISYRIPAEEQVQSTNYKLRFCLLYWCIFSSLDTLYSISTSEFNEAIACY